LKTIVRCVPIGWCSIPKIMPTLVWDDSGTGGLKGSFWKVNSLNTLFATEGHSMPKGPFYDLTNKSFDAAQGLAVQINDFKTISNDQSIDNKITLRASPSSSEPDFLDHRSSPKYQIAELQIKGNKPIMPPQPVTIFVNPNYMTDETTSQMNRNDSAEQIQSMSMADFFDGDNCNTSTTAIQCKVKVNDLFSVRSPIQTFDRINTPSSIKTEFPFKLDAQDLNPPMALPTAKTTKSDNIITGKVIAPVQITASDNLLTKSGITTQLNPQNAPPVIAESLPRVASIQAFISLPQLSMQTVSSNQNLPFSPSGCTQTSPVNVKASNSTIPSSPESSNLDPDLFAGLTESRQSSAINSNTAKNIEIKQAKQIPVDNDPFGLIRSSNQSNSNSQSLDLFATSNSANKNQPHSSKQSNIQSSISKSKQLPIDISKLSQSQSIKSNQSIDVDLFGLSNSRTQLASGKTMTDLFGNDTNTQPVLDISPSNTNLQSFNNPSLNQSPLNISRFASNVSSQPSIFPFSSIPCDTKNNINTNAQQHRITPVSSQFVSNDQSTSKQPFNSMSLQSFQSINQNQFNFPLQQQRHRHDQEQFYHQTVRQQQSQSLMQQLTPLAQQTNQTKSQNSAKQQNQQKSGIDDDIFKLMTQTKL